MSDTNQSSLDAFDATTEPTPERDDINPETDPDTTASAVPSPLTTFYATVRELFDEQYPRALRQFETVLPLTPQRDVFVTVDLPEELSVVPTQIGHWELDYHDESMITYRAAGDVFHDRFGDGGTIVRHKVFFNNRGANADDTWKHGVESCTGFANPTQIRTATTSEMETLHRIRGHDVKQNSGDYGYWSGTTASYETATEAVAAVVAQLHTEPCPIRHFLSIDEDTDWQVSRYDLRSARWEQPAPTTPYDTVRLDVDTTAASLRWGKEGRPLDEADHSSLPIPDEIPAACVSQTETRTTIAALAVAVPLVTAVLDHSPSALFKRL